MIQNPYKYREAKILIYIIPMIETRIDENSTKYSIFCAELSDKEKCQFHIRQFAKSTHATYNTI